MNDSTTYEKIVKVKNKGAHLYKKASLIMAYLLFFAVWLVAALYDAKKLAPVLLTGILCTALLVLLSWKYLSLEYEYSFWYGNLSVAKIYSKRKRKAVLSAEIKDMIMIAPASEENIRRAQGLEPEDTILAVSSDEAENIWLTVTGGKDEKRVILFFEADERSLSILKKSNPFAFVKK